MKKKLNITLTAILIMVVLYFITAFITLKLDFRDWNVATRFPYAMFGPVLAVLISTFLNDDNI